MSTSFPQRLAEVAQGVETMLVELLGDVALPGERLRPPRLMAAMRHATLAGGKRLRPFLVVETAQLLGASGAGVYRAGCAVELVHCYSLVHDDLPAMDDDDLRRGRPTVHKAFDEATAILAGDGLLTFAFDVLSDPATHPQAETRAALVLALARAAGIGGMVGGQALDLAAEAADAPLSRQEIEQLQAMKTGALLAVSVRAGAILGGATPDQLQALERFGRLLGAAFQIADDILDETGTEEQVGKRIGKDADRNKATLVRTLGLDAARKACDALVSEAIGALSIFGARADCLREATRFVAARQN
jgi:farnesyl diphosphate synthase